MARVKKLGAGVYLSVQEVLPVVLLVLCSFLKTFAVISMDAGSSVLFLNAYAGTQIAPVFIATAALTFLIWPALAAPKEKNPRAPAVILFSVSVVSLLFYFSILFIKAPWLSAGAMVWKEGFKIAAEVTFWIAAFRFGIFNDRPKTLLSVLAVQTFAVLCAAGIIRLTADESAGYLILWAAFSGLAAAFVLKILIDNGSAPIRENFAFKKQKIKRSGSNSQQRKLLLYFFTVSGLLFFAAGVFNYYFLSATALTFGGQSGAITNVYAGVFALTAVLTAGTLFSFSKGKISFFALLYLIPAALVLAAAGGWFSVFSLIAAGKAVLELAAGTSKETTLQTIPLAVSLRSGFRAAILRKSVVEPSALALCGLFIWYAENYLTEQNLIYFMTGLAVVVLGFTLIMRRVYVRLILNILKAHLWRGGRLLLTGKRVARFLAENLNSGNTQEVLYTLRIIEEAQSAVFPAKLKQALHHKNADVRLYALTKIEQLGVSSALKETEELVDKDGSLEVRQTALRVICRLGNDAAREKAIGLIDDHDMREGALTGLIAAGHEGVFTAIERTAALAASADPADRQMAAVVLGCAGNSAFYRPLIHLLNDEDQGVCQVALFAAGRLQNKKLLPAIMETFRFPELREDGIAVLLQFGEKAFPEIEKILLNYDYPIQFRILLVHIVSKIISPESENFLFKHIQIEDRRIRYNIIKALVLSGFKASGKKINIVRLCLYDEIETAAGILAAISVFDKDKRDRSSAPLEIVKSALNGEIEYIKERILLLLALLQPSEAIRDLLNKTGGAEKENETAVKIVDKILSDELRMLCLPLFENKTVEQQLALLRPHFYPPVLSVEGYIHDILASPGGALTEWTKACAAYAAGRLKDRSSVDGLVGLLSASDPIIRETAVWAIGAILPREEAVRLIAVCLSDPSAPVARIARFITDGRGQIVF